MKDDDLESMTSDELWDLYEHVCAMLADRIAAEKMRLEERLHKIETARRVTTPRRRPYPEVVQKYRNPENPAETWSGRGKQPRWLRQQLMAGENLDHFLITAQAPQERRGRNVRLRGATNRNAKLRSASHCSEPLQLDADGGRRK